MLEQRVVKIGRISYAYMYTNSILLLVSLVNILAVCAKCENINFQIFRGWRTSAMSGDFIAQSMVHCAAFMLKSSQSHEMFSFASYNMTTGACKMITSLPSEIILHSTDDNNDLILWDETSCRHFKDVFKEHTDVDMNGYDFGSQSFSTIQDGIRYCGSTYPDHKGIMYHYGYKTSQGGGAYCKSITRQQYLDLSNTLTPKANWSYYERLC